MAEKKEGKQDSKKIKIEMSKIGFVFTLLILVCVFVWSFIIGIWVGTKIASKPEEVVIKESPSVIGETPSSEVPSAKESKSTNQTVPKVLPPINLPAQPVNKGALKGNQSVKEAVHPKQSTQVKKTVPEKKKTHEAVKAVKTKAHAVRKPHREKKSHKRIHRPYYTVQVGAFTKWSSAKKLEEEFRHKGYHAEIKVFKGAHGKKFYKVFVGVFKRRTEAELEVVKIRREFGIKAFVVEVK